MAKIVSIESLKTLTDELTKNKPNQALIKKLMLANGLNYTPDSIQQMTAVLSLMSHVSPGIQKPKSKEKVSEV